MSTTTNHHDHTTAAAHAPRRTGPEDPIRSHAGAVDHGKGSGHGDQHGSGGHGGGVHDHSGHAQVFRRLFWWNLLLAMPVIMFSNMVQDWFGYRIDVSGSGLVAPIGGTIIFLWGGRPFLAGGLAELRARQPAMMLLIAVAITVAFASSLAASLGVGELDFWWELAALIVVMLLGHWLEMRAIGQASGALAALAELLPDTAERVEGDRIESIALADIAIDDVLLVRPGGRVPADGTVVDGRAALDESMITGESRPVGRATGDRVVAGTVATDAAIRVRVEAVGEHTALAGIRRLVEDAQQSRSRAQALADRAAAALFYLATATAIVAFAAWALAGSPGTGVIAVVTVLVIACPHALGLAIPLVIAISTSASARAGILVKDRLALERMRRIDTVLFDKTGTLTRANHAVVDLAAVEGVDPQRVLALAAAVETDSEHPIARAVVAAARSNGVVPAATGFEALAGRGVAGDADGHRVAVGGPALLRELGLEEPDGLRATTDAWRARGQSVLHIVVDGHIAAALTIADEIRPQSRTAVEALHRRGVHVVLLTGDARQVADAVAAELAIDEVYADVQPADKDAVVASLQADGRTVAMVGDGVNDAPALARADVGIAIGAGTDVAIESAGVVLASDDPRAVTSVIDLSRASYRKMVQNLIWATGYNLITLPVAAGAFAFASVTIPPALAAVAMSLSTIVVAANAQLLRRVELRPAANP
ncbi:MAG: copper-translocating P-type ATPase [Acidimicrobiia bacterium]